MLATGKIKHCWDYHRLSRILKIRFNDFRFCFLLFVFFSDIRNASKVEHIMQVQLRFCLLETTSEQEDYFPPNVVVKVNNKMCPLPVSCDRIQLDRHGCGP